MRLFLLCFVLLDLFFLSDALAVKDFILRVGKSSRLYKTRSLESDNYPYSLQSPKIENDEYNFFYYTEHFRVIAGKSYRNYFSVKELMEFIGNVAETVWEKEIEKLGFKAPRNSSKYYIDIYIANRSAFNPQTRKYVTIPSTYSGYATNYYDGTPYFIMNPSISENLIKVTIAHEFFHTVQFSYYDFLSLDDSLFNKNLWWLEATAVWMESMVFPEIDDYVNFINGWIETCYYDITTANGEHEYGESVIPVYLSSENETGAVEIVKNSFESFEKYKDFAKFLDENVDKYFKKESLAEVLTEIAYCIEGKECFRNVDEFSEFPLFSVNSLKVSGYYSLFPFQLEGVRNLYVESPLLALFKKDLDVAFLVPKIPKNEKLSDEKLPFESLVSFARGYSFNFKNGWNLFSNPVNRYVNFEEVFDADFDYLIWSFDNGTWRAWSNREDLNEILEKFGFLSDSRKLKSNEGFWIRVWNDEKVEPLTEKLVCRKINKRNSGWKIINFGVPSISVSDVKPLIGGDFLLWDYEDGNWKFYSSIEEFNEIAKSYDIETVEKVGENKAYWIKLTNKNNHYY